jgi:DNA-binding MarR family transcriptional regulator
METYDCILFQLTKASQAGSRYWNQKVAELNLTGAQAMVLRFLYESDFTTANDLGKRTGLDSATLTGILDRLQTAGLIKRRPHKRDRRAIQIELTEKGKKAGQRIYRLMKEANEEFRTIFKDREQKSLRDFLMRIRANLG